MERKARNFVLQVGALALVAMVLILAATSYAQVGTGHVGVERQFGAVTGTTYDEGPHITPPWVRVQTVETRPRTYTMADTEGEGDRAERRDAVVVQTVNGTTVRADITVRYRVDDDRTDEFVREWATVEQMEQRLIRPTVRSELRDEAANIQTSNIYTSVGREALATAATTALEDEFGDEPIVLEVVQVRDVQLPGTYEQALNDKEIAKQRVQEKEFEVQQERQEAERKRVEAEANADVIRIEGQALRDHPEILVQQQIAAQANATTVYVPVGNDGLPLYLQANSTTSRP